MNKRKNAIKDSFRQKPYIKLLAIFVIGLIVIMGFSGCVQQEKGTIKISGAFALYPMMKKWADEYQLLHPNITIDVQSGGAGKGMTDALNKVVNIGMVSRDINQSEIQKGAFWVSVTKDAVVATINAENPVINSILSKGITQKQFREIFINRTITTWGQLVGDPTNNDTIRVYSRSDSCGAADTWAKYLGKYKQDDLTNNADAAINGDDQLAQSIVADPLGIGFNNIGYVYDATSYKYNGKIQPVPIDLNGNGILDSNESFYQNRTVLVAAINNNIFPSPPARNENIVTYKNFTGITKDFVYWILTDGQQYVLDAGYVQLPNDVIQQQLTYLQTGKRPEIS
jgi:phosphate transport system substrate-binding protein